MAMKTGATLAVLALSAATLAAAPVSVSAATQALTPSGVTVWPNSDNQDWSLGWEFSLSSPTTVTGLGYNNYGFNSDHTVGIYNSAGTLLASAVVTGSSTLIGDYRYDTGLSLKLAAGDYYVVATTLGLNDGWIYQASSWSTEPSVSYLGSYYADGAGGHLAFPDLSATSRQYFEANFLTAIPEVSTWAMLAAGFVGLGLAGRRRRVRTDLA